MSGDSFDQAEWKEGGQHGERDYDAFKWVLDVVRSCFFALHAGPADEERWRWDAPVITLSWSNEKDRITRNLNGLVLGEMRPTGVQVEANAWYDVRYKGKLVRHWQHFPAGRVDSLEEAEISPLVSSAYHMAVKCSKKQIKNETQLPNA